MNFFQHQEDGRKQTGRLVWLFALSVLALIVLTNLLFAIFIWGVEDYTIGTYQSQSALGYNANHSFLSNFSWPRFLQISCWVIGTIALVILFKWQQLRGGGRVVAERMGGKLLNSNTQQLDERKLLNVLEEMAIAAGLPVPPVYILEDDAINAFAAGFGPSDAVIGMTRGAISGLNRDQLQGVVAHEFSHILNGDTRLNMRLIAVLAGILFIGQAGEIILRGSRPRHFTSSRNKSSGGIALLGLGLLAIGYLGLFFGNLIKAAVSRQREFLADASAVQFTRNPEGICGALKVIGGNNSQSVLGSKRAEEHSHLFFGSALSRKAKSMFATHPSLEERIRRIEPNWDGEFAQTLPTKSPTPGIQPSSDSPFISGFATTTLTDSISQVDGLDQQQIAQAKQIIAELPAPLTSAYKDTYYARAIIFALILDKNADIRERQLNLMEAGLGLRNRVEAVLPETRKLRPEQRLPLVELTIPALKQLSHRQFKSFQLMLKHCSELTEKAPLFNWLMVQLINHYLEGEFQLDEQRQPTIKRLRQVDMECLELLSFIAHRGHRSFNHAEHAYHQAIFVGQIGPANLINENQLTYERLQNALQKLKRLAPLPKERFLKACATCVESDNRITNTEWELVRVIAGLLDAPMPILQPTIKAELY